MRSIIIVMYKTIAIAMLILYAGTADAYGSLRCKGRLIDVGATVAEVVSLCGEPAGRTISAVPVRAGGLSGFSRLTGITSTEQWVYDRGWGKFPIVLFFDEGKIIRIEHLPHRSGAK